MTSKPIKNVEVNYYNHFVSEERTKLYLGQVKIDGTVDVVIPYSSPADIIDTYVSAGEVNSETFYTNACVINITAENEEITIGVYGYPIETSSSKVVIENGVEGETVTIDNPLITSSSQAQSVGMVTANHMKNQMKVESSWRADPRLDALDIVSISDAYNTNNVIMTSVEYEYNGAFRGKGEGRVI